MIWTQDIIEFQGEFYRMPRCRVEPKPVQKPRPPITIGGYGSSVVRRAVELGDGFNGGNVPMSAVAPLVQEVRDAASALGKDPNALQIVCRGSYQVHDTPQGKDRRPFFRDAYSPQASPEVLRRGFLEDLKTDPRALLGDLLACRAFDADADLARIAAPTLVVVGEDEDPAMRAGSERLAAGIRGATLRRIAAAGHMLPLEQPAALAGAVREFLGTLR